MHAEIVAVFGLDVPVDLSLGFAPISAAMYQPEWRATLKTNAGGRVDRPTQGVRVAPTGDESGSGRRTPSEPEEEEEPAAWSHKFGGLYGGLSQWKALGYPRGVTDADPIHSGRAHTKASATGRQPAHNNQSSVPVAPACQRAHRQTSLRFPAWSSCETL